MTSSELPHRVRFGPYEADLRTQELWKYGTRLKLSGQPFHILEVLLSHAGELVTRDELREKLWPEDTFVDFSHGLNAAMNKLRDALSDSADHPKYIETLPRRGYRFIASVEMATPPRLQPKPSPPASAAVTPSFPPAEDIPALSLPIAEPSPSRRLVWLAAAGSLLVLLLIWSLSGYLARPGDPATLMSESKTESIISLPEPVNDPALSPDGNRIAFLRRGSTPTTVGLFVKDIEGDNLVQLTHSPTDGCPVWSPDGKSIAFTRRMDHQIGIYIVPASGGQERLLHWTGRPQPKSQEISWSPDGNTIAFSGDALDGSTGIFLLPLNTLTPRPLGELPKGAVDWGAAFSPDGKNIAFVRRELGATSEQILVVSVEGGVTKKLASESSLLASPPIWSSDSQSVMYTTQEEAGSKLWRIAVSGNSAPVALDAVGRNASHPTVSHRGFRLAFEQVRHTSSIVEASPETQSTRVITATAGRNEGPQISPDGKHIAFMSDRSGTMEIWVANADGSNPVQLTDLGNAGTPHWSPDGKQIAFDSRQGSGSVYLVSVEGGDARPLVHGPFEAVVPSFSRSGQWVYFASDRREGWQVWKVRVTGGDPVQVTTQGGFAAEEAPDGYLYYASSPYSNPQLLRIPISGGRAELVRPRLVPRMWATWSVSANGIFLVEDVADGKSDLEYYDFARQDLRRIESVANPPFWLAASADGSGILMEQPDQEESSIVMLKNFR